MMGAIIEVVLLTMDDLGSGSADVTWDVADVTDFIMLPRGPLGRMMNGQVTLVQGDPGQTTVQIDGAPADSRIFVRFEISPDAADYAPM